MSLIQIQDAYLSFGNLEIFNKAILYINKNERICLTGKNGSGKSTLLKVISKKQDLDKGNIIYKKNIKISYLKQNNPIDINISVFNFIKKELMKNIKNNNQYKSNELNINYLVKIEKIIDIIKIKKDILLSSLSGGLLRKVILSGILVQEPDILLLDEPTNHLDIETVQWLEKFLKKFSGTILFVSHDRSFIQNICTRIIDLDRGKIISWPGDYNNFILLKNENNRVEKIHKKMFDNNLEKEEKWIRKGIKARCTRNEGRIKKLKILRETNANYKKIENIKNITINQISSYSGKVMFKLEKINMIINNKIIINNFSSIVQNGDKIGLIGKNGCGKSTLIKIILEKIKPNTGKTYINKEIKIAYFDQNREVLNPNKSILDNIDCGKEKIEMNGKEQYLIGYLKNFLFKPNQIQSLIKTLSGGECNRLLLARLFLKPSNILILDEPTNDLDLDTLQLLERIIIKYKGTVLIVSHDRKFIENTVNKYWVFQDQGYISTYCDKNQFQQKSTILKKNHVLTIVPKKKQSHISSVKKNKIEINQILKKIEKIELIIKTLQNQCNDLYFFKKPIIEQKKILEELKNHEQKLQKKIKYWEELEK